MPFEIIRQDITHMKVDILVNSANHEVVVGSGVDQAIYHKAGKQLFNEREKIGVIDYGNVAMTSAYNLDAKYVVHAVSPIWYDGKHHEIDLLKNCYLKALQLATDYHCHSIAFPLLASGHNGFPKDIALQCAIQAFSDFLFKHDLMIYLVIFDCDSYQLSERLFHSVHSYIDDHYIEEKLIEEFDQINAYPRRAKLKKVDLIGSAKSLSLEEMMKRIDETFSESLLRLIDEKGLKDSDVYKKANVDRKLFSKIRNNKHYQPSKITVLAFAIALELNLDETRDLLNKAGYALSHSNKFDIIVEYFILEKNYDIFEINEVLFAFDQPLIRG
ncbi:MAG: macro domain-containing protein [Traorella sp.]